MLVITLRAAKYSIGPAGYKGLQAMLVQAAGFLRVRQHKTEHHLHAEYQRMKFPYDGRLIQQGDSVSWGIAAQGFHVLLHERTLFRLHFIIIIIENHGGQVTKSQNHKLLLNPLVSLGVLPLKAHVDCLGLSAMVMDRAIITRSLLMFHMDSGFSFSRLYFQSSISYLDKSS